MLLNELDSEDSEEIELAVDNELFDEAVDLLLEDDELEV
ncbi:hypothetical protein CCP1ISM_20061 [Azospirillaceae bacterium]